MRNHYLVIFLISIFVVLTTVDALDDNNYFSVEENTTYTCIFINLPQDLDVNTLNSPVSSVILADQRISPWIDTTENEVLVSPGMLTRKPVCFYHEGKSEGEYSFYEMNLSSNVLGVNKGIRGGICITKYKDVDATENETDKDSNICDLLSNKADIFDAQFRYNYIETKPGEVIKNSVYVTSYAKIRIHSNIETDLDTDLDSWIMAGNPDNPTISKSFGVKAPSVEGTYLMLLKSDVMGCNLDLCKKSVVGRLKVSNNAERRGFVASVVPKNINVKDSSDVNLKLLITNYEEEMNFSISAFADPGMVITPEKKTIIIKENSFVSIDFTAEPQSGRDTLYEIDFNVLSENNEEHTATSYISFGELLTDAQREADAILKEARENGDTTTETFVLEKLGKWEEERENLDYGDDLLGSYDDFKKSLDEAKKGKIKNTKPNNNKTNSGGVSPLNKLPKDNDFSGGLNWLIIIIPLMVIIGVVVFIIYKKSQNVSEKYDYPGFDENNFDS